MELRIPCGKIRKFLIFSVNLILFLKFQQKQNEDGNISFPTLKKCQQNSKKAWNGQFLSFFPPSFPGMETTIWGNYNSNQCLIYAEKNLRLQSSMFISEKLFENSKKCLKMFLWFLFIFGDLETSLGKHWKTISFYVDSLLKIRDGIISSSILKSY